MIESGQSQQTGRIASRPGSSAPETAPAARWNQLAEICDNFLGAIAAYEDPLALLDAIHEFFVRAVGVRSCQVILQTFRGESYRIFRSTPPPVNGRIYEWSGDLLAFRWFDVTYVDHLFLKGPTQRVGEKELAESMRAHFAEFSPALAFPLMCGTEQLGLLLVADDFPADGLPNEAVERICLSVRSLNLALTRLGLLEDVQTTGRLPRGLAHDFQGLLTPVASFLQLALEGSNVPELLRELGPVATRNLAAIQQYVQNARPTGKSVSPVFNPGRLEEAIGKAFELAGPQYRARHVELEWIEGMTGTHLLMDATLMLRLIMNLLTNALNASSAGNRVEVQLLRVHRSNAPGRWLRLRVADQGRGFSAPRLAQLLSTPFGLRERRSDENGFGIGLSICRRIVRMHHGHMSISSTEGCGTVVHVDFPQKDNL